MNRPTVCMADCRLWWLQWKNETAEVGKWMVTSAYPGMEVTRVWRGFILLSLGLLSCYLITLHKSLGECGNKSWALCFIRLHLSFSGSWMFWMFVSQSEISWYCSGRYGKGSFQFSMYPWKCFLPVLVTLWCGPWKGIATIKFNLSLKDWAMNSKCL